MTKPSSKKYQVNAVIKTPKEKILNPLLINLNGSSQFLSRLFAIEKLRVNDIPTNNKKIVPIE
jgi:hypothetical protein